MSKRDELKHNEGGDEDKRVVIVEKCSKLSEKLVVPGAVKKKCSRCNEDVWLSPSIKDQKWDLIICTDCLTDEDLKDCQINNLSKKESKSLLSRVIAKEPISIFEFKKTMLKEQIPEFEEVLKSLKVNSWDNIIIRRRGKNN